MTTVLAVYNSDGCVGRCDARCHEAESADCSCICGGRYHGAGSGAAMRAASDDALARLEDLGRSFAAARGLNAAELRVEAGQGALFDA